MIYGTGIDLTEIKRIKMLRQRFTTFVSKVLTPNEQQAMAQLKGQRQNEFLAGRFSAKEAYSKAYGTGLGSAVGFQDVEILDEKRVNHTSPSIRLMDQHIFRFLTRRHWS